MQYKCVYVFLFWSHFRERTSNSLRKCKNQKWKRNCPGTYLVTVFILMWDKFPKQNFFFLDARSGIHIPSVSDVTSRTSSHWMDTTVFGHNRVVFDTSPGPERARLKIFNVSETDDGLYRCRVDFKASQTRTIRLNLTVVGK